MDNPARLDGPFTYAVWGGAAVQVGMCRRHPKSRMAELQTGNPRPLALLAYDARLSEREAHRKLHRHRLRGEWFALCPEVLDEISRWDWLDVARAAGLRAALVGEPVSPTPVRHPTRPRK